MGLIIKNEIYTDAGVTNELYINIHRIEITKNSIIFIKINRYLNKNSREIDKDDIIMSRQIEDILYLQYSEIEEQLKSLTIHEVIYESLKQTLESKGHTVVDDNGAV